MEVMKEEDALMLVTQVQKAHRLAVGFYQRILPTIEDIAHSLDMRFWYWGNSIFSRPATSNRYPGKQWSWDLVPMSAPLFVFLRQDGSHMQAGDLAVEFQLHFDPVLTSASKSGQPDPLALGESDPILQVFLFWPTRETAGLEFKVEWEVADYPQGPAGQVEEVSPTLSGVRLEFSLAKLVQDADAITAELKSYVPVTAAGTVE